MLIRYLLSLTAALIAMPVAVQAQSQSVTWADPIEVASGDAHQGPWRMNASQFLFVDDPTVAINEGGVVGVAWANQSLKDIYLQIYGPDGKKRLDLPVNVSRTPKVFSWLPRMVISDGEPASVFILWQEIRYLSSGRRSSSRAARTEARFSLPARATAAGPSTVR
jgi:hypothetical protein